MKMSHLAMFAVALLPQPLMAQAEQEPAAAAQAAIDPARLAAARPVVERLFPVGTYKQLMKSSLDMMSGNMSSALKNLPLQQIARMAGASDKDAAQFAKVDIEQVMAIYDPHWQERMQLTMRGMMEAIGVMMEGFEPRMRDALTRAYAQRFTAEELGDLARYFSTPTGAKYASRSMLIMTDPEMVHAIQSFMPEMMQRMPEIIATAQKATASLPPPRRLQDLSTAEREKLAKLLGVSPEKLQDPKSIT
jgi:hypothetical protein